MTHTDKQLHLPNMEKYLSNPDPKIESMVKEQMDKLDKEHTDKQPQTVTRWVRSTEKPVPDSYTGELRIYGNTDRKCGYTSYQIEYGYAGTFNNSGMVNEDVYWLEEIPNVYLFTPAELEALKVEWQRETAEKAFDLLHYAVGGPNGHAYQPQAKQNLVEYILSPQTPKQ